MTTKLTWFGHAALGLETGGYKVVIDPFLKGNPAASTSPDSVAADYILISHGHGDHVGDALEIAQRTGAMIISNDEIANWCAARGVKKTHGQHLGGGYRHSVERRKVTFSIHGWTLPDGSNDGNPCGFLLTANSGEKIYMAQDTGLFGDMKLIGEEGLDLAVIPIGDNYTMGPDDALRAVKFLEPKVVIPIHYNTFDLLKQDENAWAERVQKETDAHVVLLKPGESYLVESK
jgi:L-ascorbate metabolism protein UlaG (beta-lactamase superfamily)